ncbi:MAG: WXG100 family type VII secretion target [Ardenticatenaceae bacterium]|nr:WXG100 family type VII secretion target [Ardenticatenaceae bacterium]
MTDIIQSDYEKLDQIAEIFGRQAEASAEMHVAARKSVGDLQGGGWIGHASEAFYAEMDDLMFPALERLISAMQEAKAVTLQIKHIIQEADEEASAPFRGGGGGVTAGPRIATQVEAGPIGSTNGRSGTMTGGRPEPQGGTFTSRSLTGEATKFLEDNPMVGFRLFGVGFGSHQLIQTLRGAQTASPAFRAIPVVGGIIGTIAGIAEANANGENMDFAVGREITKGTLKTEVYLVPGVNIVAGGFELAHMFGITDTNYTNVAVNTVAEPVHKYALDPASDVLAEGLWQADQGIRWGVSQAENLVEEYWPF